MKEKEERATKTENDYRQVPLTKLHRHLKIFAREVALPFVM